MNIIFCATWILATLTTSAFGEVRLKFVNISTQGLLYASKGNMMISNEYFETIYTVSFKEQHFNLDFLKNHSRISQKLCSALQNNTLDNTSCLELQNKFDTKIKNLEQKLNHLSKAVLVRQKRSGPAAFEEFGNLMNKGFGTPTKEHADKLEEALDALERNSEKRNKKISDNLRFLSSNVNNITSNMKHLKFQVQETLNENFETFHKFSVQVVNRTQQTEKLIEMNMYHITLRYLVYYMEVDLESIENAIQFAYMKIVSPNIVDPGVFIQHLTENEKLLKGSKFPVEVSAKNFPKLMELSEILLYWSKSSKELLFIIRIPITKGKVNKLYEILSFPVGNDKKKFLTKTDHKYLYKGLDSYGFLENLDNCRIIDSENRVCQINQITEYESEPCEMALLNGKNSTNCKIEPFLGSASIVESLSGNNWLVSLTEDTPYSLTCGNYLEPGILNGTLNVTMDAGCSLEINGKTIHGTEKVYYTSEYIIPTVNINEAEFTSRLNYEEYNFMQLDLFNMTLEKFNEFKKKIEQQQEYLKGLPGFAKDDRMWSAVGGMVLAAVITIAIIYFILKCCGCWSLVTCWCCCGKK